MNFATIKPCDIADGEGVRVGLYVSGCTRKCKGCHNQVAQDFNYGTPYTRETTDTILELVGRPYCSGLSILGGEPMEGKNRDVVISLCKEVKEKYPDKDIWMWTGYTYEELLADDTAKEIFKYIDYVVDGPFVEELKDLSLRFCGSSNQRIIKLHPEVEVLSNRGR